MCHTWLFEKPAMPEVLQDCWCGKLGLQLSLGLQNGHLAQAGCLHWHILSVCLHPAPPAHGALS